MTEATRMPASALLVSRQGSERTFFGWPVLLFLASAAATVLWCDSMPTIGGMPMPGGWTMSMAWMRMPGETWAGAAVSFLGMWVVMMAAMMLPSLTPLIGRYRQPAGRTALAGLGYFSVWALIGLAVFPVGVAAAAMEMDHPSLARAVPVATALTVLMAGALQFTKWKAHHLVCCRQAPGPDRVLPDDAATAWRQGLRFGFHCGLSCANLTAVLLAIGVMDLRAMAVITAAITAERLAPAGERVARAIGCVAIGAGLLLLTTHVAST